MIKATVSLFALAACTALSHAADAGKTTPYAGQQAWPIKALTADEIDGYLAGKGMGLAKTAELNGYPGPSHVLALASELGLSAEQKLRSEALLKAMESSAKEAGRRLVEEELRLDQSFASRTVTPETLAPALKRIGELQAQVRLAHLEAHLAQAAILTPQQMASYTKLRGYGSAENGAEHAGHPH